VSWLQKGHHILVNEQCKVKLRIDNYKDEVLCDIIPMDACHILLGRSWKYDRKSIHDGRRNTYCLEKNRNKNVLLPLQDDEGTKEEASPSVLLISGKELLQEVKKEEEMHFFLIGKPNVILTNTNQDDLHTKVKAMLDEFVDIIVDDFTSCENY
jgi:hypothetical protein